MESRGKRKKFSDQPRDIQNIVSILQKMGIEKFESNVPHMLFEFSHSFAQEVLEDSRNFAEYAGRQKIDASDVQLAIQNYNEKYFTRSLRPDFLKELANVRNKVPIPPPPAVSSKVECEDRSGHCLPADGHVRDAERLPGRFRRSAGLSRSQ
eukprot:TRINITY_DN11291_c0_g1_i1.p1 TRINITY_DN11291_c0_g1~~TRINITY_DN11291_c0_g1_i1.p1  ORF type:complete len:152 (-),score=22.94 TRINITY_DN11291_c0_g1_i1:107-562(-)